MDEFGKSIFFYFFYIHLFLFHYFISSIEFHNLFHFIFYKVITVLKKKVDKQIINPS